MDDFWYRNIIEPGKLPPLLALFAFVATFLVTRFITRMIRSGRGPFRDNVSADGTHIHHSVPGLFLLVLGSFTAISVTTSPWEELAAIAVGAGTSLVLDEFALILHLKDVYWSSEGRISVEIVGLAAAVLAFVTIGLVPFGVDSVDINEFGARITLTTSFALNAVMVLLCLLKGKYRFALVGTFIPLTAWGAALRLARPKSWWAQRWYSEARMSKALAREDKFQAKWDPRWRKLGDLVAGRPTGLPTVTTPTLTTPTLATPTLTTTTVTPESNRPDQAGTDD